MTFLAYLKDRLMMILACLAGMAVVSGYLLVCGLTALQCSLLLAAVSICLLAALGINWAFAPIIDIDYNFRNPINHIV